MKAWIALAASALIAMPAVAAKSCDELKGEIEAKIKGKGVQKFTLEVVPAAEVKDQKVVGSCEGGAKKIVYKRG